MISLGETSLELLEESALRLGISMCFCHAQPGFGVEGSVP